MTTISPLTRAIIEKNKLNNNQTKVQAQTPAPEIKSDTVELSTKNKTGLIDKIKANKKIIIPAAIGLAAIAGIAGGLIFAIKTGKISFKGKIEQQAAEILGESKKIQKTAEKIKIEAQKQYDEIMEILKKAKEEGFKDVIDESGKTIRKFYNTSIDSTEKIMDELDGDKILRKTYFNPSNLEISRIDKGITQNADKIESVAESFDFSHGKLLRFTKNYKWHLDGTQSCAEDFIYSDGKLSKFTKDYKWNPNRTISCAEGFIYSDDKLSEFVKDFKSNPDGTESMVECFDYSNDKLSEFVKDFKSNPDGTTSWAEKFVRNAKGKLKKVDPQAI